MFIHTARLNLDQDLDRYSSRGDGKDQRGYGDFAPSQEPTPAPCSTLAFGCYGRNTSRLILQVGQRPSGTQPIRT